jgi:hypothetical protein
MVIGEMRRGGKCRGWKGRVLESEVRENRKILEAGDEDSGG